MPRFRSRPHLAPLWLPLLALIWCTACGDDSSDDAPMTEDGGPPRGLRVFYALDDPATVDLVLFDEADAQIRVDGIRSGQATDHQRLTPGLYRMSFFEAGTTRSLDLNLADVSIEDQDAITITVAPDETGTPARLLLQDEITLPEENQSRVRLVNLALAPDIDITNTADGMRWADGLAFGQLAPYRSVPLGTYMLDVADQATTETLLAFQVPLRPAEVSTVFLIGSLDPNDDGNRDDSTLEAVHVIDHTFE